MRAWSCVRPIYIWGAAASLEPGEATRVGTVALAGGGRRGKPRSRLAGRARPGRGWTRDAAVEIDGERRGSKPRAHDPRSGAGLRLDSGGGGVLPGSIIWSPSSSPTRSLSEARPGRRSARWADVYDRDRRRRPQNRRISRRAALSEDGRGSADGPRAAAGVGLAVPPAAPETLLRALLTPYSHRSRGPAVAAWLLRAARWVGALEEPAGGLQPGCRRRCRY